MEKHIRIINNENYWKNWNESVEEWDDLNPQEYVEPSEEEMEEYEIKRRARIARENEY